MIYFFEQGLDLSANVVHKERVMPSELLKNLMEQAHNSRLVCVDVGGGMQACNQF
jgi:hypothetical protein